MTLNLELETLNSKKKSQTPKKESHVWQLNILVLFLKRITPL